MQGGEREENRGSGRGESASDRVGGVEEKGHFLPILSSGRLRERCCAFGMISSDFAELKQGRTSP